MLEWNIRQVVAMALMALAALGALLAGLFARKLAPQRADTAQLFIRLGALALALISAAVMFL